MNNESCAICTHERPDQPAGTASDQRQHTELVNFSSLSDPCTSAQLAAVLGKSPKTLVDWCQEREYTGIPCFRLGNKWYHRVAELKRWLNGINSGQIEFRRRPRSVRSSVSRAKSPTGTASPAEGR